MFDNLFHQARRILGRRRIDSSLNWLGQFGWECPQLGIYDTLWGKNRVVNEGINQILNSALRGEGVISAYYIAPFVADVVPPATLTAANFNSTLTEFINYDEATRPAWVSDAASTAQLLENAAAPALFTIAAGAQTEIRGAVLHSSNSKSGNVGTIIAAAKAPAAFLNLADGFEVKIKYRLTGTSS